MTDAEAAATLRRIHRTFPEFGRRIAAISERFVGTPYVFSPLGEGPSGPIDRDPLFDLHHVDCLTLVEETLAMAHTPDLPRAKELLQHIRYEGGVIDFARRHHFAMNQWIPANQKLGVLRDITRELGKEAVIVARKRIDEGVWKGKWRLWRRRLGAYAPRGEASLPVIPIEAAVDLSERFPAGALVSVVRVEKESDPNRVSHQGIVVVRGGRRFLRHASSGPRFRRVIDYPLRAYFRFSQRYFQNRWKVLGVNVQELRESEALKAR
jgi:hypothetical protein